MAHLIGPNGKDVFAVSLRTKIGKLESNWCFLIESIDANSAKGSVLGLFSQLKDRFPAAVVVSVEAGHRLLPENCGLTEEDVEGWRDAHV